MKSTLKRELTTVPSSSSPPDLTSWCAAVCGWVTRDGISREMTVDGWWRVYLGGVDRMDGVDWMEGC